MYRILPSLMVQVHPYDMQNPWVDLKNRVSQQRRVFGFFHGSMPEEPLVVLHTALMDNLTSSMEDILGENGTLWIQRKACKAKGYYERMLLSSISMPSLNLLLQERKSFLMIRISFSPLAPQEIGRRTSLIPEGIWTC